MKVPFTEKVLVPFGITSKGYSHFEWKKKKTNMWLTKTPMGIFIRYSEVPNM